MSAIIRIFYVLFLIIISLTLTGQASARQGFTSTLTTSLDEPIKLEVQVSDDLNHRAEHLPKNFRDRTASNRPNSGFANNGYYGQKDLAYLTKRLEKKLRHQLQKKNVMVDPEASLLLRVTLVDAKPNRPTFYQLSKDANLSHQSIAIGGAEINSELIRDNGEIVGTFSYRYYESDILNNPPASTWQDALRAISRFSHKTAKTLKKPAKT